MRMCICPALNHLNQTTPPNLTDKIAHEFDMHMIKAAYKSLTHPQASIPPNPSNHAMMIADIRLQLPIRMKGCGHTSARLIAPLAWVGSVMDSCGETTT